MPSSTADLVKVALAHSAAEGAGDMAGTMGTLEANPVYDFYPMGRRMTGLDQVRRYYEHFFAEVQPRIVGYEMIAEWIGDAGVNQEYTVRYRFDDGSVKSFRILGILTFGNAKLSGERLYANEEFFRILIGPVWSETEQI
ncbi:MAG TPA: hypothetical protein VKZ79_00665 [Alphaproteobacteria bacterium]|nr:hypothetical protein [Alphaproteobacteria bacterium]